MSREIARKFIVTEDEASEGDEAPVTIDTKTMRTVGRAGRLALEERVHDLCNALDRARAETEHWRARVTELLTGDASAPDAMRWELPDGTGRPLDKRQATEARYRCETAEKKGALTRRDLLVEQVSKALAEDDQVRLRAELVASVAACARWIAILDERAATKT